MPYSFVLLPPWRNLAPVHAPTNPIWPLFLFCMRFSLTFFFFFLIKCWKQSWHVALFSGQVEAGGETVGFCLSWRPSVGGRVTPCGVSEDLRWSRAAMSNPSMRLGGSTFKTCSEATPFSPSPLPLTGPSCPCLLSGPHFCPGFPQPLLTMGGTGTLSINMVALVPTLFKMVQSFMANKHLHVCQLFTVPSALQSIVPLCGAKALNRV